MFQSLATILSFISLVLSSTEFSPDPTVSSQTDFLSHPCLPFTSDLLKIPIFNHIITFSSLTPELQKSNSTQTGMFINLVILNFNSLSALLRNPFRNLSLVSRVVIRDPHYSVRISPNLTSTICLSMKLNAFNVIFRRIIVPSLGQSYCSSSLHQITTSSSTGSLLYCFILFSILNWFQCPSKKTLLYTLTILNYPHSCHRIVMPRISDIIHAFKDLSVIIRKYKTVYFVS